jgi:hypothetical protein
MFLPKKEGMLPVSIWLVGLDFYLKTNRLGV